MLEIDLEYDKELLHCLPSEPSISSKKCKTTRFQRDEAISELEITVWAVILT